LVSFKDTMIQYIDFLRPPNHPLSFYNKQIYSVVELTSHIIYIHIEISTHN